MPEENARISATSAKNVKERNMKELGETESTKEKVSRYLLPLAVLVLGLGAGAVVYTSKPPVEEQAAEVKPRTVNTMAIEISSVSTEVESQGTVEPRQMVSLVPQVSGEITWVSEKFVNGGVFNAGEKILEVDPRDYELAVISAEALVADAAQQLETAKAQTEQAISEWNQLKRGAPTELALRKPQLAGAEAKLKSAQAELLKARLTLERTNITAPFNSIVTAKSVDQGQFVSAGTQLAELSSSDTMEIRLSLPEREVGKLDLNKMNMVGLRVRLSAISGDDQKAWYGQVIRKEGRIDPKTRNTVVVAQLQGEELIAEDGLSQINIGQFVRAQIEGRDFDKVYELPRVALHNGDSVYVVDLDNRLRERKVTIVDSNDQSILVAQGLNEGEVVTVSPMTSGVEGVEVVSVINGGKES